jgi:hypothetical protein
MSGKPEDHLFLNGDKTQDGDFVMDPMAAAVAIFMNMQATVADIKETHPQSIKVNAEEVFQHFETIFQSQGECDPDEDVWDISMDDNREKLFQKAQAYLDSK